MNKTDFIEKYTIDEQGFYIHGVNPDDIEEDLTAFEQSIREDCVKTIKNWRIITKVKSPQELIVIDLINNRLDKIVKAIRSKI